ncbi:MAG: hypothetical protein O7F73_13995 [Gammaproteobacteria bacterium]|nr:hypothetical protein [Gammaproteobacteria bacterium]
MRMPLNVWLLMAAQALNQCCASMIVLVGGLIGAQLAPIPELVTLPVAVMVVGTALPQSRQCRPARKAGPQKDSTLHRGGS